MYKKTITLIAIVIFISVLANGLYRFCHAETVYTAELVCTFNTLKKRTFGEMVRELDKLAQAHSYNSLARTLNIPLRDAQSIISIDGRDIWGNPLYKDDYNDDNSPMYVVVKTTDVKVFDPLQKSILGYLNSSPFMKKRKEWEAASIQRKIKFINEYMTILDSVISFSISTKFARPDSRNNSAVGAYNYPAWPSSDSSTSSANIVALLGLRDNLNERLLGQQWRAKEMTESVEVLHGFVVPDHPSDNRMHILFTTAINALLSLVFFAVLIGVVTNSKLLAAKARKSLSWLGYVLKP